jgi:hypothetical protein
LRSMRGDQLSSSPSSNVSATHYDPYAMPMPMPMSQMPQMPMMPPPYGTPPMSAGSPSSSPLSSPGQHHYGLGASPPYGFVSPHTESDLMASPSRPLNSHRTSTTTTSSNSNNNNNNIHSNIHSNTHSNINNSRQSCRYFSLPGGCKRGDKCHFAHVSADGTVVATQTQQHYRSPIMKPDSGAPSPTSLSPVSSVSSTGSGGGTARRLRTALDLERQAERDAELGKQLGELDALRPNQLFELLSDAGALHYLTARVDAGDARLIAALFADIGAQRLAALATDRSLNVLCQKLIEHATHAQRRVMRESLCAVSLASVACNLHGTRVVQKLVDGAREEDEVALLVTQLRSHVVELACDVHGNHVIQRCLAALAPTGGNQFVYDALAASDAAVTLSTLRHGCSVLQRCIDHASPAQQTQLRDALVRHFAALAQSPFGNYVAQYALERDAAPLSAAVAPLVKARLAELSSHRYGSNVVEKLLRVAPVNTRHALIDVMIRSDGALALLAQDSYGNYVVQTALTVCTEQQRHEIVAQLTPLMASLRKTAFGKRMWSKLRTGSSTTTSTAGASSSAGDTNDEPPASTGDHRQN